MNYKIKRLLSGARKRVAIIASTFATGLFGTGKGESGQLGDTTDYSTLTSVVSTISSNIPSKIITGFGDQSMVIWSDGVLYGMGVSRVGLPGENIPVSLVMPGLQDVLSGTTSKVFGSLTLKAITTPPSTIVAAAISKTSTAELFSAIACGNGNVYGSGDNSGGQLTGDTVATTSYKLLTGLPGASTPIAVSCGRQHIAVLLVTGAVYYSGILNGQNAVSTLTLTTGLPNGVTITDISSAEECIFGIGSDGIIYALGFCSFYARSSTWKPINAQIGGGIKVVRLSAGINVLAVIGNNGVVYGIGNNTNNELTGSGVKTILTPYTGLPNGVEAVSVSFGLNFCLVVGSDGNIYHTGVGNLGQGGGTTNVSTLTPCPGLTSGKYGDVVTGGKSHTLVKTNNILPNLISFIQTYGERKGWYLATDKPTDTTWSNNYKGFTITFHRINGVDTLIVSVQSTSYNGGLLITDTDANNPIYKAQPTGFAIQNISVQQNIISGTVYTGTNTLPKFAIFNNALDINSLHSLNDMYPVSLTIFTIYYTDSSSGILYRIQGLASINTYVRLTLRVTNMVTNAITTDFYIGVGFNCVLKQMVKCENILLLHVSLGTSALVPDVPAVYQLRIGVYGTLSLVNSWRWTATTITLGKCILPTVKWSYEPIIISWYNGSTGLWCLTAYNLSLSTTAIFSKSYPMSTAEIRLLCSYMPVSQTNIVVTTCFAYATVVGSQKVLLWIGANGEILWGRTIINFDVIGATIKDGYIYLQCNNLITGKVAIIKYDFLNAPVGTFGDLVIGEYTADMTTATASISISASTSNTSNSGPGTVYTDEGGQALNTVSMATTKTNIPVTTKQWYTNIYSSYYGSMDINTVLRFSDRYVMSGVDRNTNQNHILSIDFNGNLIRSICLSEIQITSIPVLFKGVATDTFGFTVFISGQPVRVYILDATLTVISQFTLSRSTNVTTESKQLYTVAPNGDYYIGYFDVFSSFGRICIAKYNSSNVLQWANRYVSTNPSSITSHCCIYRMHYNPTASVLVVEGLQSGSARYHMVYSINTDGTLVATRYSTAGPTASEFNLHFSADNNSVWAEFSYGTIFRLVQYTANLSATTGKNYGSPTGYTMSMLATYTDGSYVICGYTATTIPAMLRKYSVTHTMLNNRACIVGVPFNGSEGGSRYYELQPDTLLVGVLDSGVYGAVAKLIKLFSNWPVFQYSTGFGTLSPGATTAFSAGVTTLTTGTTTVTAITSPPTLVPETVTQFPAGTINESTVFPVYN